MKKKSLSWFIFVCFFFFSFSRMKTQLDVMNIASNLEKPPAYMPKKIDIKSVVNEILALELTPVDAGIIQGREEGLKIWEV